MPLLANRDLNFYTSEELVEHAVDLNATIFKGALVGRNRANGYARPLVIGDEFLGVAYRQALNNFAGAVAGGISVKLHQHIDIVHTLTGVNIGDVGKEVFAIDDSTVILTPLSGSRIGRIVAVEGANLARIRCQPISGYSGTLDNYPVLQLADTNVTLTLDQINRVLLMANTAARTVTLPAVSSVRIGAWIRLIKTNANAFAITIDPNAAELIDGAATLATVDSQFDCVQIMALTGEWVVLNRDLT